MEYEFLIITAIMILLVTVILKMPAAFEKTHGNSFDKEYKESEFLEQLTSLVKVFGSRIYSVEISKSFMEVHTFSHSGSIDGSHSYTFWYSDIDFENIDGDDDCPIVASLLCTELGENYCIDENNATKIILSAESENE